VIDVSASQFSVILTILFVTLGGGMMLMGAPVEETSSHNRCDEGAEDESARSDSHRVHKGE